MKTRYKARCHLGLTALVLLCFTLCAMIVPLISQETLAAPSSPDSISGFLWVDGNGTLSTDWDGLYNGGEQPLPGYTVSLYAASDLAQPIATTQTDMDGTYSFEALAPGHYVVGVSRATVGGIEYLPPVYANGESVFTLDESSTPFTAYSETIEIVGGATGVENISAGMWLPMGGEPRTLYTIDVSDYYGLIAPGNAAKGYIYATGTQKVVFNTNAAGNSYTIIRTGAGVGSVRGFEFVEGGSPASVSFNNLLNVSSGLTLPTDFQADLTFNNVQLVAFNDVNIGAPLMLPEDYRGTLDIHGLTVTSLAFPPEYPGPITFNGLELTGTLTYPTDYTGPITIGGPFKVPSAQQFPSDYTGSITIGDAGGEFTNQQTICRAGTSIGFDDGIFILNNISTLTIKDAKTGGSGRLAIKLGATDDFELLLDGDSTINGYIEVPAGAALTIDSKASTPSSPHSEDGRLAITSATNTAIGTTGTVNSGEITINGGTVEATAKGSNAGIGSGSGQITINGGKTVATCIGDGAAIGSSANNPIGTVADITINGGTVEATAADGHGAAIGSGKGATGGYADNTTSVGAVIKINGGTVVATAGTMEGIYLGSGSCNGAAIGGGQGACADITITGGHITANSMHGAGIGNGAGAGPADPNKPTPRGSVVITTGTLRGYSMDGTSIGRGSDSSNWRPTYSISKNADILMHRRTHSGDQGGLVGWCDNPYGNAGGIGCTDDHGDNYLVNFYIYNGYVRGDLYVYEASTGRPAKKFSLPENHPYGGILFSTSHSEPEEFRIFVDTTDGAGNYLGMKQVIHYYNHDSNGIQYGQNGFSGSDLIPSIQHMNSYPHNFAGNTWHALMTIFGEGNDGTDTYFKVTEHYVDKNGSDIRDPKVTLVTGSYTGPHTNIDGYDCLGYKLYYPLDNASDYTPNAEPNVNVTEDFHVYYVYEREDTPMPPPTGINLGNTGAALLLLVVIITLALLGWYMGSPAYRRQKQRAR